MDLLLFYRGVLWVLKTFGQATGGVLGKSIKGVTNFTVEQIENEGFKKLVNS